MASAGEAVLSYGDSLLRESEMKILRKYKWLNDVIIGFYFEYLGTSQKACDYGVTFYHPGISQLLKIINDGEDVSDILNDLDLATTQYGIWAVNDSNEVDGDASGTHWSLLVFSRPDDKFLHFDSWNGSNNKDATKLYDKLRPSLSATATFHPVNNCVVQVNGQDCGLHVLKNAQLTLEFIKNQTEKGEQLPKIWSLPGVFDTATPEQAAQMRQDLITLINTLKSSGTGDGK